MGYDFDIRQESYSTFLHPNGLPLDPEPYVTEWGLILPGLITARYELDCLMSYIKNVFREEIKARPLPTIKQLGRIALNEQTGCWELPIYKNGHDVHPKTANRNTEGKPRARYGSLMVRGASPKPTDHLAHRTMYSIMRQVELTGLHVDHLCRNAKCCYHRHLEAVTVKENTQRIHEARILSNGQERINYTGN